MKKIFKRGMSGLLAVLMAFTVLVGFGTTTAFAASETAESYMISFPRDGDAAQIYSEDAWGHSAKNYMNGWATGSSNYTIRTQQENAIKNGYRQDCPKKAISAGQNRNLFVFAANLRFLRLLEN